MNEQSSQIQKIIRLIETAESSIKSAKSLLSELTGGEISASQGLVKAIDPTAYQEGETQIVEGTFDGQNMIGPNEKIYPVSANYASKSKLVEGDRLKLTIMPNGSFLYKQISPCDRDFVKGNLIKEDGQFKVLASGKSYRVLLASVTYYKGNVGDEVTLILPKNRQSVWGAIEAIIPQLESSSYGDQESF